MEDTGKIDRAAYYYRLISKEKLTFIPVNSEKQLDEIIKAIKLYSLDNAKISYKKVFSEEPEHTDYEFQDKKRSFRCMRVDRESSEYNGIRISYSKEEKETKRKRARSF